MTTFFFCLNTFHFHTWNSRKETEFLPVCYLLFFWGQIPFEIFPKYCVINMFTKMEKECNNLTNHRNFQIMCTEHLSMLLHRLHILILYSYCLALCHGDNTIIYRKYVVMMKIKFSLFRILMNFFELKSQTNSQYTSLKSLCVRKCLWLTYSHRVNIHTNYLNCILKNLLFKVDNRYSSQWEGIVLSNEDSYRIPT